MGKIGYAGWEKWGARLSCSKSTETVRSVPNTTLGSITPPSENSKTKLAATYVSRLAL